MHRCFPYFICLFVTFFSKRNDSVVIFPLTREKQTWHPAWKSKRWLSENWAQNVSLFIWTWSSLTTHFLTSSLIQETKLKCVWAASTGLVAKRKNQLDVSLELSSPFKLIWIPHLQTFYWLASYSHIYHPVYHASHQTAVNTLPPRLFVSASYNLYLHTPPRACSAVFGRN